MQGREHPLRPLSGQFGYPLSFRVQVCGTQRSLPCFLSMVLNTRRPPSLRWVPMSSVPQHPQYYEVATTSRCAIPSTYVFALGFRRFWPFVFADALPAVAMSTAGPGVFSLPTHPNPAQYLRSQRDLTGSLVAPPAPMPCSKTPVESRYPGRSGYPDAVPTTSTVKTSAIMISRLPHGVSARCLRFKRSVTGPLQDSLPAGGLRLCREGVEPSGSQ